MARNDPEKLDKLDVPQGTLDLMILTILAREPLHGYGISQRLTALSHDNFQVNPGSLFPSLYRLEQDGKLKAEWRPSENNRNAKYYALTASGRKQLEQHRRRSVDSLVHVTHAGRARGERADDQPVTALHRRRIDDLGGIARVVVIERDNVIALNQVHHRVRVGGRDRP